MNFLKTTLSSSPNRPECNVIYAMSRFSRLVRFLAKDGKIYYGDAILPKGVNDIGGARQARVIKGNVFGEHNVTEQIAVRESYA